MRLRKVEVFSVAHQKPVMVSGFGLAACPMCAGNSGPLAYLFSLWVSWEKSKAEIRKELRQQEWRRTYGAYCYPIERRNKRRYKACVSCACRILEHTWGHEFGYIMEVLNEALKQWDKEGDKAQPTRIRELQMD